MKKTLLILLMIFLALWDAYSYACAIQSEISQNVIRLHVIANSDEETDQELKLKVRDAILAYMKEKNFDNYQVAYESLLNAKEEIRQIAKNVLETNQCADEVQVLLGNFDFPCKTYGNLSFPAGNYTAIRIIIGNGQGHNWWCVMYPTLCFTKDTCKLNDAEVKLQNTLSKDAFSAISNNHTFQFKIVEFFQKKT